LVVQDKNCGGINFCPHCHALFEGIEQKVPLWIFGVLVILTANWLRMCHL
jgi:hypothetical protein